MTSERSLRIHRLADLVDPISDAVYQLVHNYRDPRTGQRGATALAPKAGMVPGTLMNKANPGQDHQLTLGESVTLQLAAAEFGVLRAYAMVLGHAVYELPAIQVDDLELLNRYTAYHQVIGEHAARIHAALSDQRITAEEVVSIRDALHQVIGAGLALVARIEALAE